MKSKILEIGACLQAIIILSFILPQQALAAYYKCPAVKFNDFSVLPQETRSIGGGKVTDTSATNGEYKQHFLYVDKSQKYYILDAIQSAFYMNYSVHFYIDVNKAKCTDNEIYIYGVTIDEP